MNWPPVSSTSSRPNPWSLPPEAQARSSRPPPMPTPSPVTAWPSPTVTAFRWKTWSSFSSIPPVLLAWAFSYLRLLVVKVVFCATPMVSVSWNATRQPLRTWPRVTSWPVRWLTKFAKVAVLDPIRTTSCWTSPTWNQNISTPSCQILPSSLGPIWALSHTPNQFRSSRPVTMSWVEFPPTSMHRYCKTTRPPSRVCTQPVRSPACPFTVQTAWAPTRCWTSTSLVVAPVSMPQNTPKKLTSLTCQKTAKHSSPMRSNRCALLKAPKRLVHCVPSSRKSWTPTCRYSVPKNQFAVQSTKSQNCANATNR